MKEPCESGKHVDSGVQCMVAHSTPEGKPLPQCFTCVRCGMQVPARDQTAEQRRQNLLGGK